MHEIFWSLWHVLENIKWNTKCFMVKLLRFSYINPRKQQKFSPSKLFMHMHGMIKEHVFTNQLYYKHNSHNNWLTGITTVDMMMGTADNPSNQFQLYFSIFVITTRANIASNIVPSTQQNWNDENKIKAALHRN